jgi:hypothetical protein
VNAERSGGPLRVTLSYANMANGVLCAFRGVRACRLEHLFQEIVNRRGLGCLRDGNFRLAPGLDKTEGR